MLTSSNSDPLSNWKNKMEKRKGFQKHQLLDSHIEAVARELFAQSAKYLQILVNSAA